VINHPGGILPAPRSPENRSRGLGSPPAAAGAAERVKIGL
jgi:hypothetical protein